MAFFNGEGEMDRLKQQHQQSSRTMYPQMPKGYSHQKIPGQMGINKTPKINQTSWTETIDPSTGKKSHHGRQETMPYHKDVTSPHNTGIQSINQSIIQSINRKKLFLSHKNHTVYNSE